MSWEGRYPAAKLVPYDPGWAARYAELATALRRGLGLGWQIEHVGSTSVPGLSAKPVIDLALCCPDADHGRSALAELGWTEPIRVGDHLASFLLVGTTRTAIAHIFSTLAWPEAHVRLFAKWLREHPEDRDAYAQLKAGLVEAGTWGTDYTVAKRGFVQDVVNRARGECGLPPVVLAV